MFFDVILINNKTLIVKEKKSTNNTIEESKKGVIKVKKVLVTILLIITTFDFVNALEYPEITNDIEIRYKWYKEVITGDYYPLKNITSEDKIDITKLKYGNYSSSYKESYCSLSPYYYLIEEKEKYIYQKVSDIRYVLLENFNYDNNIKIYYQNEPLEFKIISNENSQLKIDLNYLYQSESLLFIIDHPDNYKIGLYLNNDFQDEIISKKISGENIIVPDKTWITNNTVFWTTYAKIKYKTSDLTKLISVKRECRYREKYVYKYTIKKEYYDDQYHLEIDGYTKDINDYKIFYKGEPLVNTIEITKEIIKEKLVKVPQIEYVYIETEQKENKIDSSQQKNEVTANLNNNCLENIKTEIIEKEVQKIPKKIYIIIFVLIAIIIILVIKIYKKYVV